jgi:colanic acid/amylovoran biosynthesis protein
MTCIYFSGQRTFGNRGCEAIVRSTVRLLREHDPDMQFLVPSSHVERDAAQWPDAAQHGVTFVRAWQPRHATRYWVHMQRLPLPSLKRAGWPFPAPAWVRRQLESVDGVLAIGGDNYSLDYRLPSPVMGLDRWAMDMGKPVVLWGASVGPFEREPHFLPAITRHLGRMKLLAVRESLSHGYVQDTLKLDRVIRMMDPAFALEPDLEWPLQPLPEAPNGTLGFNLSPLLERYRREGGDLRVQAADFIRDVVARHGMSVVLVPHVDGLGLRDDGDRAYLAGLHGMVADLGTAVRLLPAGLNAARTKAEIARLRFFIGARTHATIAALSSGVPTVAIAYSVKARGIHRDLLGDEEGTLAASSVSTASLHRALDGLLANEQALRVRLAARTVHARAEARQAARRVVDAVQAG